MKTKVNGSAAVVVVVVAVLLLFGVLYRKYMYQPTYSAEDLAAKYKGGPPKAASVPPNRGPQGAGATQ